MTLPGLTVALQTIIADPALEAGVSGVSLIESGFAVGVALLAVGLAAWLIAHPVPEKE